MTPLLRESPEGVYLQVKVQTKASRCGLGPVAADALKVAVNEAPEKGKANAAVCRAVAEALGIAPSRVEIVAGDKSRRKTLLIRGGKIEEIRSLLRIGRSDPLQISNCKMQISNFARRS